MNEKAYKSLSVKKNRFRKSSICMLISFLLITFFELFWALTFIPLKIRMVVIFIILITYTICLNKKGKIFLQKN